MRRNRFKDKLTKIDEHMKNYFENNYEIILAKKMLSLWEKEIQNEEINIIREFTRKGNFIEDNMTDKPKTPNTDTSNQPNQNQNQSTAESNNNGRNNGNHRQDNKRIGYQQRPQNFNRPHYQRNKPRNGDQHNTQRDHQPERRYNNFSNPGPANDNGNVTQTHQNEQGMRNTNFREPPNHQRRF